MLFCFKSQNIISYS